MNKIILAIVVVGLVIGGLFGVFGGKTQDNIGGVTFENETFKGDVLVEQRLSLGTGTGTSTVDFGKFCLRGKDVNGTTRYVYLNSTGNLATTTSSCF